MWTRPGRGERTRLFGAVALCAFFLTASFADAQYRRSDRSRNKGRDSDPVRIGGDPTDPAAQTEANLRKAQRYYDTGTQLRQKGRLQAAKGKFKTVVSMLGQEGLGAAAAAQLVSIHDEGMAHLDEVRRFLADGKYVEALELARQTKTQYANIFGGLSGFADKPIVSRLAVELIARIEADPTAAIAIQEHEAAKRFAKVERLEELVKTDREKYYDLYKALKRIVDRYPDCPTGERCAARLAQIKADRKLYRDIKDEEKRRFISARFQQAEQYEKLGMADRAKDEYAKLKKRFPGQSMDELRKMADRHPLAEKKAEIE